jgi:hypothetical protein
VSLLSNFALVLQADDTFGAAYGGRVFGKAMPDLVHLKLHVDRVFGI